MFALPQANSDFQMASIVYLETPAGTGYSFSTDRNLTFDDNQAMNMFHYRCCYNPESEGFLAKSLNEAKNHL